MFKIDKLDSSLKKAFEDTIVKFEEEMLKVSEYTKK
jgi:hypothetical protein